MGHDVEKDIGGPTQYALDDGVVPGESFEYGNSTYAKLQRLAGKMKIEQRGIERVPENERDDDSLLNVGTMVCQFFHRVSSNRPMASMLDIKC
jgi:hypothetical protein